LRFHLLYSLTALLVCSVAAHAAATQNETASASFQKTGGYAGISLRTEDPSNQYQVRFSGDTLEFLKLKDGTPSTLGSRTIAPAEAYNDGEQWTISATASGHTISARLFNNNGTEITSGTIFDRDFTTGTAAVIGSGVTSWTPLQVEELPQYETAPADLLANYDVVIAGAGTAGSIAAVQAARQGASVLVVEETDWIGGQMAAAAISSMDEGNETPSQGVSRNSPRERGLYKEFFENAVHMYGTMGLSTDTCYVDDNHFGLEPRTAQALLFEMFQDVRTSSGAVLHVTLETSITEILKNGNLVTGADLLINTPDGPVSKIVGSKILIDATEYGDILPLAGARYRVGNWISDEDHSSDTIIPPIQDFTWAAVIKHYPDGTPPNLMMDSAPTAYGKYYFEGALDNPEPYQSTSPWSWQRFIAYRGMPNSEEIDPGIMNPWAAVTKTHMNFGANDVHIDARDLENLDSRMHKFYLLKLQTLKLMYYFQNDMTVPVTTWTIAMNEGFDTPFNRAQNAMLIAKYPDLAPYEDILNQFPPMPYARESRRMVGVHTIRAKEIDRRTGPHIFPTSVAVGDYGVDLHGAHAPDQLELDLDDPEDLEAIGFAGNKVGPFTIPYEAFVPETLDGFLAAEKNISQSRLVNGATRLQPSTMLIGQAAGAIAAEAVKRDKNPRDLNPAVVQKALLDHGDVLYAAKFDAHKFAGVEMGSQLWKSLQFGLLYGFVKLSDTNLILNGWKAVAGGTGPTGWHLDANDDYAFTGVTGIATYDGMLLDGNSATTATDYKVSTRFVRTGGSGTVGLVGRLTNTSNFYHARVYFGNLQLYKWVNGTATSLGSVACGYVNGQTWTLEMTLKGSEITASLYDSTGALNSTITRTDSSLAFGVAGLRAQPGTADQAIFKNMTILTADEEQLPLYYTNFPGPVNVATDALTRGDLSIHLARFFDVATTAPVVSPAYADVPSTHPAFNAVQGMYNAGITLPTSDESYFNPDTIATRADLAVAMAKAYRLDPAKAPATPYFTDVPNTHPAFPYIQLMTRNLIGAAVLNYDGPLFAPDSPLGIADSINLYADLLVNPPDISDDTISSVQDWELY